ncbi:MAG: ABC transporter substrate-binding protein [Vogesella sp.]|nr:ABC transporter substrate-binding protein [Vogesella sp.]
MKKWTQRLLLSVCWWSACSMAQAATATTFRVVTEDAPPFTYWHDGELAGPVLPFVDKLMQAAGLPYTHHVYPWARSLALAQHAPNVLIYALARTPEREASFHWIGELVDMRIYLYGMVGRKTPQVDSLAQARQLRIGVINKDVRLDWLKANGFSELSPTSVGGLDLSENSEVNMLKLRRGMVDAVPVSRIAMQTYCRQSKLDCGQFRQLYPLPMTMSLYLAASKKTSYEYVNTLRYHYRKLVQDGSHHQAFSRLNDG